MKNRLGFQYKEFGISKPSSYVFVFFFEIRISFTNPIIDFHDDDDLFLARKLLFFCLSNRNRIYSYICKNNQSFNVDEIHINRHMLHIHTHYYQYSCGCFFFWSAKFNELLFYPICLVVVVVVIIRWVVIVGWWWWWWWWLSSPLLLLWLFIIIIPPIYYSSLDSDDDDICKSNTCSQNIAPRKIK